MNIVLNEVKVSKVPHNDKVKGQNTFMSQRSTNPACPTLLIIIILFGSDFVDNKKFSEFNFFT